MRVSIDEWEPPPKVGGVPFGQDRVEAVNTVKCPKCGAEPMYMCVYVQVPLPLSYSRGGYSSERYRKSGTPTKVPHLERLEALRERRRRTVVRKRQKAQLGKVPSAELMAAAHAMRQFDSAEYWQLRSWIMAYGDILVGAGTPQVLAACN